MAGTQINVLPRQEISIPNVTGTASFLFPFFARVIDVLGWVSGSLLVSVYQKDFESDGGTPKLNVFVVNVMVARDDPSIILFPDSATEGPIAAVEIDAAAMEVPRLYTSRIPTPSTINPHPALGRYISVGMNLSANGTTATGGKITMAVDLIGRDG
jgi:hypothetical protein